VAAKGTVERHSKTETTGKSNAAGKAPHETARNVTADEAKFLDEHVDELSKSTLRAKWIHSVDEHEDRPGQTLATQSHEVIKQWAKERGGVPATIPGTEHDDRPGVLRIDIQGKGSKNLEQVDWNAWFKPFDARRLVFLYQEHKRDGQLSTFFRLDNPTREDA
jgi:hypothetical protein